MLDEQYTPGQMIDNQFKLLRKLGEGGMGQVFLAEQVEIERPVVIKFIHLHLLGKAAVVERFRREAKLLSRIQHPNVVNLYTVGQAASGEPFLVMEYIDGQPLSQTLREHHTFPASRALHIAAQVASALAEAHAHNIVHRDLKPDNIMLARTADGVERVKLLDFGIARLIADAIEDPNGLTHTGAVMGTPRYMSPEQINSDPIDGRADIYALGLILYEMLSGEHPIRANTPMQFMMGHISQEINPVSTRAPEPLSPAIDALLLHALARDRAHRFASAMLFQSAIQEALAHATAAPTTSLPEPPKVIVSPAKAQEPLSTPLSTDPLIGLNTAESTTENTLESLPPAPAAEALPGASGPAPRISLSFADTPPPQTQQNHSESFPVYAVFVALAVAVVAIVWWRAGSQNDSKDLSSTIPEAPVSKDHSDTEIDPSKQDVLGNQNKTQDSTSNHALPQDPPPVPVASPQPDPSSAAGRVLGLHKGTQNSHKAPKASHNIPDDYLKNVSAIPAATLEQMRQSGVILFDPDWSTAAPPTLERRLAEAQHLARLLIDDAQLSHISAYGTLPPDGAPRIVPGYDVVLIYLFISPRVATPSEAFPANTRRPCLVGVSYMGSQGTASISTHPDCKHLPVRGPLCSSAQIWARAIRDGASSKNTAATLTYRLALREQRPEWVFSAGDESFQYPDDCARSRP